MPSLTHIVTMSPGALSNVETRETETWKKCRAWRVRRPSVGVGGDLLEGTELEELSAAEGEEVIDREELTATTKTVVCTTSSPLS